MKVYSWKILFATIFIGGGAIIYAIKNIIAGDMSSFILLIFSGYLFIKGLWVSFTKEGFQSDKRDADINNEVIENLFGDLPFIIPWGGFVLIILAGIIFKIMPSQKWLYILLLILGLVYQFRVHLLIKKHIKQERRKYF